MKNTLENKIKSVFENYEADYNSADWIDLEKRLDAKSKAAKITKGIIYSVVISVLIGTASGLVFFFSGSGNHENKNNEPGKINLVQKIEKSEIIKENPAEQPSINVQSPDSREPEKINKTEKIASAGLTYPEHLKVSSEKSEISADASLKEKTVAKKESDIASDTIKVKSPVSSYPAPKATFRSDKNTACANSAVQFYPDNSDIPCEYRWDFGDGEYSADANPKHIYKNPGNYSVKLEMISLLDKKSDIQVMKDMITVNPVPMPDFNWKVQSESEDIYFEPNHEDENLVEWKWEFGDKQNSSEKKPSHLYAKKGSYHISLSMKNNYGCTGTCRKNVIIANDFNLLAPNAFSPNGDGKNDTWLPVALLSSDYIFSLTILDKNGNIAFKTSSANNPWDGRHARSNDMVKTGDAFKWIAIVKDKNGIESTYGGVLSITESSGY